MKGIKNDPDRQSEPTYPIRNFLLKKIVKKYKNFNYTNLLWKAMVCCAKGFALRCGEYTPNSKKPTKRTLKWKDLNFHTYNGHQYLSITLRETKTNKTKKTEILTRKCLCACHSLKPICAVCTLKTFKTFSKLKFKSSRNSYVFLNSNGTLVTGDEFRAELKQALIFIGIKNPKFPYWRAHSLRHGEITDLIAAGVPIELVRKYARHVPKSPTTFLYIQLETDEEAKLVAKKFEKYFR